MLVNEAINFDMLIGHLIVDVIMIRLPFIMNYSAEVVFREEKMKLFNWLGLEYGLIMDEQVHILSRGWHLLEVSKRPMKLSYFCLFTY